MEFKTIEADVKTILEENEQARADDNKLYMAYCWEKLVRAGVNLGTGWFESLFADDRKKQAYGIADYKSVSRVRRKLQADFAGLRPSYRTVEERKKLIKEYRAYARKNRKNNL